MVGDGECARLEVDKAFRCGSNIRVVVVSNGARYRGGQGGNGNGNGNRACTCNVVSVINAITLARSCMRKRGAGVADGADARQPLPQRRRHRASIAMWFKAIAMNVEHVQHMCNRVFGEHAVAPGCLASAMCTATAAVNF